MAYITRHIGHFIIENLSSANVSCALMGNSASLITILSEIDKVSPTESPQIIPIIL